MSKTAAFIWVALVSIIAWDVWAWSQPEVPTITHEVRHVLDSYGVGALALTLAVGFTLGHLFWTPKTPKE